MSPDAPWAGVGVQLAGQRPPACPRLSVSGLRAAPPWAAVLSDEGLLLLIILMKF